MKFLERALEKKHLFRNSLLFSLLFHLGLFGFFHIRHLFNFSSDNPIEIDLTQPFRIGGNPLLKPGGGTTEKEVKNPGIPAPMESEVSDKKTPPRDWVLPGPDTKILEKPVPDSAPLENRSPLGIEGQDGEGITGKGPGLTGGEGEGGGIKLDRYPNLINKREILRLLKKNYPPAEREAGITSRVIVDLHLDAQGNVTGVDVAGSGGKNFDSAAQIVAPKMRFQPALINAAPVAVKIRQSIIFKLEDEE
ncbi:MAG: hypothetical protein A2901_05180 [Elusimicrobia bacterium RIFCSPLOWO2_01_FULL_54_10]|nr:MAG: hypothetical protein A2901_05180 [Elusimicrobia bacterium RIFCSPLOWO2_01_FULL_54_10]